MKLYVILAATTMLAACGANGAGVTSASDSPAASVTDVPTSTANAEMAKLFNDYDKQELSFSPLGKAYRGIRDDDYGKWDDPSDEAAVANYERGQRTLTELESRFDPSNLNDSDQLSYRLFQARADRAKAAFGFRENYYIFDQMNGVQSDLPAFLINIHRVTNKADAEAYISRLEAVGTQMDVLILQSRKRADNGVIVPDWVFPYVINDSKNIISGAPFDDGDDSPIFADLKKKVSALGIAESEKSDLIAKGAAALTNSFGPAYERLIVEMKRQQSTAVDGDGVWRFKDGAAYYAERLKNYTTTDLTANEIHQIGLDNVARIHGEMRKIMAKVGFEGTLGEFFVHLRTSDQYFHTSREDYLAEANTKLAAMEKKLPEFFNTLPKAPFVIKPVEAFREKSAGKAFYQRPAPDGSRPGTYYVNLYDLKGMSKTELEALAYHEALPGHHLQLAIQTELGDVPAFRKFGGVTAYSEGWGLYTEELGKDMGFYTDPYSDFGRLGMELWRACRLVVDTGMHDKRWSREKAIAYLTENTPNPDSDIRKAIERYIVYPGQATAYMIGKLKILELRGRAQKELGSKFTMGDFHDVILKSGPVPLNIMEERVDSWIAANKP
ncbi:MAG: DUF885 domain-containing protein [Parasphingorhabdus sp.]